MVYSETLTRNYDDRMGVERILFDAVVNGKLRYLTRLLDSGFNPNVLDQYKQTPLIKAINIEDNTIREKMIRLLILHGADADYKDKDNMDVLMHAALNGLSDTLPLLVEHSLENLDLRRRNKQGSPLLNLAVISGDQTCVEIIAKAHDKLAVHVDDVTDKDGITPFMEAKRRGFDNISKFLANECGASSLRVDNYGNSTNELYHQFQKARETEIERQMTEWRKIFPPRYSIINPPEARVNNNRNSYSAYTAYSRDDTSDSDAMAGLYRRPKPRVTFKIGKVDVTRNQFYMDEFTDSLNKFKEETKDRERETRSADPSDKQLSVTASLSDIYERKMDRIGALYMPSYQMNRVTLEPEQMVILQKEKKKQKKRQKQRDSRMERHVGYSFTVPDEIRQNLNQTRETSFAIRRPSMANSRKSADTPHLE